MATDIYIPEFNEDGTVKHVVKEGSYFHHVYWDSTGHHCSEPNCEMNKPRSKFLGYPTIINGVRGISAEDMILDDIEEEN